MKDHLETMRQIARTQRRRAEAAEARVKGLEEGMGQIAAKSRLGQTDCPLPSEMREINRIANHYLNRK